MMLIRNADIYNLRAADLRIKQDRIAQIGSLAPEPGAAAGPGPSTAGPR